MSTCARSSGSIDKVNPSGLLFSTAMMSNHIRETEAAGRLEQAVAAVIGEGRSVTWDLRKEGDPRPPVGTKEMGEAIVEKMQSL